MVEMAILMKERFWGWQMHVVAPKWRGVDFNSIDYYAYFGFSSGSWIVF